MGQVAKRISDKRVLKLTRAFLNAGVMENGLISPTDEGTPQGARSHLCSRIWCSMSWTANLSNGVTALSATPMTVRHDGAERRP